MSTALVPPTDRESVYGHGHDPRRPHLRERFWSHVDVDTDGDCWEWTGATGNGYSKFRVGDRVRCGHRVAYALHNGMDIDALDDMEEDVVRHTCHNRKCVNPDHLVPGSHRENKLDSLRDGEIGELSAVDVREIRRLAADSDHTYADIGDMFDICVSMVSMVKSGDRYGHVGGGRDDDA